MRFGRDFMATLTIKNLPDELYAKLAKTAKRHRRSINSEAIVQLEEGLRSENLSSEALLEQIRQNRLTLEGVWLTDELLDEAKNEGRP
jgi:antitoxin FitA